MNSTNRARDTGHFLVRLSHFFRDAALWIYHLPKNTALLFSRLGQAIASGLSTLFVIALKVAFIAISIPVVLVVGYGVFRLGRAAWNQYLQRRCELRQAQEQQRWLQQCRALEEEHRRQAEVRRMVEAALREEHARQQQSREEREAEQRAREDYKQRQHKSQEERLRAALAETQRAETARLYTTWRKQCDIIFAKPLHPESVIPVPPIGPCGDCRQSNPRTCRHSLEKLFRSTGNLGETVKRERIRWHPDQIAKLQGAKNTDAVAIATEMFQVIGNILGDPKAK